MPTLKVTPSRTAAPGPVPEYLSTELDALGSREIVRAEIDAVLSDVRSFAEREPDEVMRLTSGYSARMTELRVRIQRVEDVHRIWRGVRTREVEPVIDELKQQYLIASRLLSCRELDFKLAGGGP
jgi:hypothetical protein